MLKRLILLILFINVIFRLLNRNLPCQVPEQYYAGIRVSRIPFSTFPEPNYFSSVSRRIASYIDDAQPCLIWIVGIYWGGGDMGLNFPKPDDDSYPYIHFSSYDQNEDYLDYFDEENIKIWIQVEPGDADIQTLIDLCLNRYKHHPCVMGFGIDVEWYRTTQVSNGKAVTDTEATDWRQWVKAHNQDYRLFLKHYMQSKMPPTVREDILFVDDSQIFNNLTQMVNEFKSWGTKFSPAEVGFQFGYPADRPWWSLYNEPARTLVSTLHDNVPNASSFFWVDFTIQEIFPYALSTDFQSWYWYK